MTIMRGFMPAGTFVAFASPTFCEWKQVISDGQAKVPAGTFVAFASPTFCEWKQVISDGQAKAFSEAFWFFSYKNSSLTFGKISQLLTYAKDEAS